MATKYAMHLLQQKQTKSTTRWNDKKLRRGLSGMVIIHQSGTVDLVYNKSGVMGASTSNNTLKLRQQQGRTSLVIIRMSAQIHTGEKKALEPKKRTKQLPHQRAAPKSRATYHHGPSQEHQNSANSK